MKFSLLVCTYKRAMPLLQLLESVAVQSCYPSEILIIDGSVDDETSLMLSNNLFLNLTYFKVSSEDRGLTRQRNFGIKKVSSDSEILCFLDDDTVLEADYFEKIISVFQSKPDAIGVGGVSVNDNAWKLNEGNISKSNKYYTLDGYFIKESSRNYLRNILGLQSDKPSNILPSFGHGKNFSYPLNNKTYQVELLIGMSMSFRRILFDTITFSEYFNGYGLYEDADFSLRALQFGKNYITTAAKLSHFHHPSGRPNQFLYGKMVVRNGYYVWKIKNPKPSFKSKVKWHVITLLLTLIRFTNVLSGKGRKKAFTESLGRTIGWFSLFFKNPK